MILLEAQVHCATSGMFFSLSGPQFPQQSLEGLWPCSCKITLLPASPPLSPGPVRRLYPSGDTQDSRELHWAPKNPGLHRQRPGFTHTSSSRQASSPSQMAEKHPKRCSSPLSIREMKIKTSMRYHLRLVRRAIIKKSTNNKSLRGCGENGTLLYCR